MNYIINEYDELLMLESDTIAKLIYLKAQETISRSNLGGFPEVPEWNLYCKQIDLFKIKHFDNKAKIQSLKGLEFWMNYENVQDMPIHHTADVKEDQIAEILAYNLNDVKATFEFYQRCLSEITLRDKLSAEFSLNLTNANDPKIGAEIFAKLLSEDMGIHKKELKLMRTFRKSIDLKDVILPIIEFKSNEFNKFLAELRGTTIYETKGAMSHSIIYKGFKYDFGLGGIHGCIKPGVYKSDEEYEIKDIDVSSFYPNLAIVNGFRPKHLGESFNKIYKHIYQERKKFDKKDPRNAAYKLMLNGVYGKSNSKFSYLYDPFFTMCITINGQLLIAMLGEQFADLGYQIIQVNTDGITIKYPRNQAHIINEICKKWCELTQLDLEFADYDKMVIMDVNNYIGIFTDPKKAPKYKGLFEIDKEPHKDTSFLIIPKAISEYFITGRPIEDIVKNHTNIYDFCGRAKFMGKDYGEIRYIRDSEEIREKQQKTTRYYISTNGSTFVKMYNKGSEELINKGYNVTIFNTFELKENYNLNYSFYIAECYKILDIIEDKQLTLF